MKSLKLKKSTLISLCFTILCFIFFLISMYLNRGYYEELTLNSITDYELGQLCALFFLFGIGLLFMLCIRRTLSLTWCCLLSFPMGICLWVFGSMILLLSGIPYTFLFTIIMILLLLLLTYLLTARLLPKQDSAGEEHYFIPILLTGLLFLAASGFNYSFVSYDSYFYFINYGHTLTIVKNFKDIVGENSFTLTNICQFVPLIHSYTSFWGLDQAFGVQAFLTYDIVVSFFYGLWQYAKIKMPAQPKKTALFCFLFALLLASSTSFITISTWVLANMYCMAYIFFLFLASFWITHLNYAKTEAFLLIALHFSALALLRKDGIIFAAFFLVCFSSISLCSKWRLALLFVPAVVVECIWLFYVRIVLNAGVTQAVRTSIANNKNIAFILLIIAACFIYIFLAHDILTSISKKHPLLSEYMILLAGLLLLFFASFIIKTPDIIIDNVDYTIRNMFRYPSAWGISAFFFGVLIPLSLPADTIGNKKEVQIIDYLHFIWFGYALLNLISYCLVDSKVFWVNWDDSYSRVLLQIVPVFLFIMAVKLLDLLQFCTQDHNSGS